MKPIKLTGEQLDKLGKLAAAIAPHFVLRVTQAASHVPIEGGPYYTKHREIIAICDKENTEFYPWLEFCFVYLVPFVAAKYTEHHIDSTKSWSTRMLSQHIAAQMNTHNPIDTLYDIWENPGKYAEDM